MKKTKRGKKKQKPKDLRLYSTILFITFVLSAGVSYFYLKDKFAFESSFIADIESSQIQDQQMDREGDLNRLYESRKHASPVRHGTVFRKDEVLVAAEDFIRKQVSSYKGRLLDLYLDKEGVIYIDFGSEIQKNFNGDVNDELSIIGGLYKGLKETIPGLSGIKILIEGKEAESLGGHINILKPIGEEIAYSVQ